MERSDLEVFPAIAKTVDKAVELRSFADGGEQRIPPAHHGIVDEAFAHRGFEPGKRVGGIAEEGIALCEIPGVVGVVRGDLEQLGGGCMVEGLTVS